MSASSSPAAAKRMQLQVQSIRGEVARLRASIPGLEAKLSPLTRAVEVLLNTKGALTGPAPGLSGDEVVRTFVRANGALYGLLSGLERRGDDALHVDRAGRRRWSSHPASSTAGASTQRSRPGR